MSCEVLLYSIVEVDCRDPPCQIQEQQQQQKEEEEENIETDDGDAFDVKEEDLLETGQSVVPCVEYRVLNTDWIRKTRDQRIGLLCEITNVSIQTARNALRRRGWDLDKAIADIPILQSEEEKAKQKQHQSPQNETPITTTNTAENFECPTCMDDVKMENTIALACGHRFCNNCWKIHCELAIKEGRARRSLNCMARNCSEPIDFALIQKVVSEDMVKRYEEAMLGAFVEDSNDCKWCPAPGCENAIVVDDRRRVTEIHCNCGLDFCFKCRGEAHFPATCEMAASWKSLLERGTVNCNWIRQNTKPCPKCKRNIEKDDGCNLMSCPCGQHFCWKCGGPTGFEHTWDSISNHSCEEYLKSVKEKKPNSTTGGGSTSLQLSQNEETRLESASDKHNSHILSSEYISEISLVHEQAKSKLKNHGMAFSPQHMAIFDNALSALKKARRVLSWSYVFAFFAFRNQKQLLSKEVADGWNSSSLSISNSKMTELSNAYSAYQNLLSNAANKLSMDISANKKVKKLATWELMDVLKIETNKVSGILSGFYDLLHANLAEYFPQIPTTVAIPSIQRL